MNKIYKVVWNKARNCYVVASEFAKNHQTGSKRIKAASVAAVMAATMITIGTGVIYAADVTDTEVKELKETIVFDNTTDTTTKLNDPNLKHDHPDTWVHGHTDGCGELTYNTTLTIGDINKVADKLVANDTSLYNQGIKNVTLKNGTISLIRNNNDKVNDDIILTGNGGVNGQDTAVTVTVGKESKTFQTGSVVTANTDTNGKATGLTINGTSYDIKAGSDYHWDLRIKGKTEKEVANDAKVVFGNSDNNITVTDDPLGDQDKKNLHVSVGLNSTVTIGTKKDGTYNKEAITIDGNTGHITGLQNKNWNGTTIESGRAATEDQLQQVAQSVKTYKAGENVTIANDGTISATDTKYSAGNNVKIDKDNTISVNLSKYAKSDDVAVVYQDNDKNKSLYSTNAGTVGSSSIALGKEAVTGNWSVALGDQTKATALDSIAIGGKAKSTGGDSIAIGNDTNANSQYSVAIGDDIHSTGYSATAVGQQAHATGECSTALGAMTNVDADWNANHPGNWRQSGAQSTTIGYSSGSWGDYSTALGAFAKTENKFSSAIGYNSQATAENAVALGAATKASVHGGVALGTLSVADREAGTTGAFAPKKIHETDQSTWKATAGAVSVGNTNNHITRQITNVAAGSKDTDAVNVAQLKQVNSKADSSTEAANKGWNLSTNNKATEATKVAPGDYVDFSGDDNITVSNKGTKVKVALNKDIDVNSVQTNALNAKYNLSVGTAAANGKMPFFVNSNGAFYAAGSEFSVEKDGSVKATSGNIGDVTLNKGVFYKNSALRDGELYIGDVNDNYSQITSKNAKLGKVTIDDTGRISGVVAGKITADSTDAVNGSQLHAVQQEAGKHTKVVNGSNITVDEIEQNGQKTYKVGLNKDILLGDATGKNVNISGTNGTIETTGYIATKDRVYADKGAKLADVDITKDTLSNGSSKVVLNEGYAGMAYGDTSIVLMQDNVVLNSKVIVGKDGKISGVAAGRIATDSTDAVNGSQLHAVQQEAGKHTKVVNGSNITVEETDQDGQKTYKVGLNKDILLGDINGKYVSISGSNGTIDATGYIATKDRVYADKGAKLADVDVTGNTISNDKASVKLDKEGTVTINNKVTVDQNGKVSGVANGDISDTSTDAVNGSQLKKTNDRVTQVENDVKNIQGDITTIKGDVTKLDNRVTEVEKTAGKHSSVSTEDSNLSISEGTNSAGGTDYKLSLNKDLKLDSVTTGNTKMDANGVKVGENVSLTKDGLTAGDTKVTNAGLSIGDKTYVSKDGLNANGQKVTNVADGKVEKGSTDAVNGGQLYETNQAVINNANNISSLSHSISNLDNRVNKVGAGAAALAALHPLDFDPDAKWDFAAGYGNYRGTNAAAVGAYYRPNEDTMFSVGGTFGNGENMVNAGVSFKLGAGSSHVSTSRVAMAKEIKELRSELEAMKSAMLDANAGKKIDTSKLQLFPDVPQNHWAYEYITQLAGNGMIEGYPDGNFAGDRPMTRYEFAAILYRAMTKGAVLSDKILSEFSHELEYFTVDTIAKDKAGNPTIQRVRTVKVNKNK